VTLSDAGKIFAEDRAGNRDTLEDIDCIMLRKIKETCKEAETKRQECIISRVCYEEFSFKQVVDIKIAKW
jgi:hypothetical protein